MGSSRKQLYARTIPGVIAAIERFYGLKEGTHFGWGKPPKDVPKCIIRPKSYDNCLWFANGVITHCASLSTVGSVNGQTLNFLIADECKFLPKKKIDEEVMPALSGIVHPLGDRRFTEENPFYKSTFFCSDASLSSKGNWLSKEEDHLDDVINHGEFKDRTYRDIQTELDRYADHVMRYNELLRSAKKAGIQPIKVSEQTKAEIDALWDAISRRDGQFRILPPQYKDPKAVAEYLLNYKVIDAVTAERLAAKNFLLTHEEVMELMAIRGSKKYQQHINNLRCNSFYFVRASSIDNIDILGEDYIRRMKRDLPPLTFAISILNIRPKRSGEGFYCNFDPDIHCYLDEGDMATIEDSIKVKQGKMIAGGTAYNVEYESPDFDLLSQTKDCSMDGDLDPKLPLEIALDYNNLINWVVIGQLYKRNGVDTLNVVNSMFVKNGQMIQDLIRDFDRYYAPHKKHNRKLNYYFSHTAKFKLHGIAMLDIKDTVIQELKKYGWEVNPIDEGQAPKHEQKYQSINEAFGGMSPMHIAFNRENNEALIGAIENCDVQIGYNGFRKDKSGEKMSVDAEDATPEELRTDGTDAFDELFWGVRHFRNNLGFLMMPDGT